MTPDPFEITMVLAVLGVGAFHVFWAVVLWVWGRWVAKRQGGRVWRRATWLPVIGLGLGMLGLVIASQELVSAFGSVASASPETKAKVLSSGISEAMNNAAVFIGLEWVLTITTIVVLVVGSIRKPRVLAEA